MHTTLSWWHLDMHSRVTSNGANKPPSHHFIPSARSLARHALLWHCTVTASHNKSTPKSQVKQVKHRQAVHAKFSVYWKVHNKLTIGTWPGTGTMSGQWQQAPQNSMPTSVTISHLTERGTVHGPLISNYSDTGVVLGLFLGTMHVFFLTRWTKMCSSKSALSSYYFPEKCSMNCQRASDPPLLLQHQLPGSNVVPLVGL